MKNIYTIATDKPSRLYYNNNDKMLQFCDSSKESTPLKENRNIYIISDDKIVEGDYGLGFALGIRGTGRGHFVFKQDGTNVGKVNAICDGSKKIIITTDGDLIRDGVQKIGDDFLHWFIVNSSCDRVELEKTKRRFVHNVGGMTGHVDNYKIIIPSEEVLLQSSIDGEAIWGEKQKQHLIDIMKADEGLGLYEEPKQTDENGKPLTYWGGLKEPIQETCNCIDECLGYLTKTCKRIEEPKQETLEEASSKVAYMLGTKDSFEYVKMSFELGAKWQQEQFKNESTAHYIDRHIVEAMVEVAKQKMYSEEEVLKAQQAILGNIKDAMLDNNYIIDYLKQLKK